MGSPAATPVLWVRLAVLRPIKPRAKGPVPIKKMPEAAVSRILLSRLPGTATIRLGPLLPAASSSQPVPPFREEKRRAVLEAEPIRPCTGRGLPSPPGHPDGWWALTPPFHPYPFRGGLFSVALSLGSPPVAVSDLPALWCPDFPPPLDSGGGRQAASVICLTTGKNKTRGS